MQKTSLLKISCWFLLINLFSFLCVAAETDDVINDLIAKSSNIDMSASANNTITDFLNSKQNQSGLDIESQLKDIEREYMNKIDSIAVGQKEDALANSLVSNNKKFSDLDTKSANNFSTRDYLKQNKTQHDVEEYLKTTTSGSEEDLSGFMLKDSIKDEDLAFEAQEFGQAVAKLSMIDGMKNNIEQDTNGTVSLFKGECLSCEKEYGSDIKNCCNLTGIFRNIIGPSCPRQVTEVLVPAVVRDNRCYQVADFYCVARYPWYLGKGCRKWRKTFCCYQSKLGRIFQQIAHYQLDISWGSGEHPNCGPLDPKMFSKLNFDDPYAISLLQELMGEINNNTNKYINNVNEQAIKSSIDITNKIKYLQQRISFYFNGDKQ